MAASKKLKPLLHNLQIPRTTKKLQRHMLEKLKNNKNNIPKNPKQLPKRKLKTFQVLHSKNRKTPLKAFS